MSFNINYKGTSCRGTTFLYKCIACDHEQHIQHPAAETSVQSCEKCSHITKKVVTCPSLGADFHDSCKSYNIGWDADEG